MTYVECADDASPKVATFLVVLKDVAAIAQHTLCLTHLYKFEKVQLFPPV